MNSANNNDFYWTNIGFNKNVCFFYNTVLFFIKMKLIFLYVFLANFFDRFYLFIVYQQLYFYTTLEFYSYIVIYFICSEPDRQNHFLTFLFRLSAEGSGEEPNKN